MCHYNTDQEIIIRKPRDFDSELKALEDKARMLRKRKLRQLGELVAATGADALDIETLAGALLASVSTTDAPTRERWRQRGAAFFRRPSTGNARQARRGATSAAARAGDAAPD